MISKKKILENLEFGILNRYHELLLYLYRFLSYALIIIGNNINVK